TALSANKIMTQKLAVIQQVMVPGDAGHCWKYLSDPRLISEWFADTDQIRLKEPVQFAFGDGDYFAGTTLELEEPTFIRLVWKFMGLGGQSDISLFLCPLEDKTEVTVLDRGEYTPRAAKELREGWRDFLSRLERRITTGENSRYRWSPDICIGAVVQCDKLLIVRTLRDISWWRDAFPHSNPVLLMPGRDDEPVQAIFQEAEWSGQQTEATVEIVARRDGLGISVMHAGWADLPLDIQLDARRRVAALWQHALLKLEHRFGVNGKCHSTSSEDPNRNSSVPAVSTTTVGC
ncbi:MAG: SRPBCC domain-containing protein, partial [Acidobacteriia bacterium]|nr:SRPBCC domain-containing protein [Terriglobia bacterium]